MTVIRTVERSLTSKSEEEYARPCVYEVFLLGALCACSEMGISHIIVEVNLGHLPASVASIIPQPKMIHCNEIFPEEAELIKLIARRGVEEIISAPQQKESRRMLYNLCTELNCNHAVVARGEIETDTPGFKGIPFTYRNFSAVSGTQLQSMVALSASTLTTIRELAKLRIKITDEDAYAATEFWYYNATNEIHTARIGYRTDIDQSERISILIEEIVNMLGISDTELREDSIVYQYSNENTTLSDEDWVILKLLYDPRIKCGFNAQECSEIFGKLYY
jgi:hypothetical protein